MLFYDEFIKPKKVRTIKTLIELFDDCQIENVVAALRFKPEKIIFVGFKSIIKEDKRKAISNLLARKNINTKLEYEIVSRYDYNSIVNKLNTILDLNDDCYFDITGGKDIILAALGEVAYCRNVPVFQLNVITGEFIPVKNCSALPETQKSSLTISECVDVNGCAVMHNYEEDFVWDLNPDFKKDIETMWSLCKKNCGLWNRESLVFESLEKYGSIDSSLFVRADLKRMKEMHCDTLLVKRFTDYLEHNKLIDGYKNDGETVQFCYKNSQVHQCISKAGNILELYIFSLLSEIASETPGCYDDIDIGVYIDWDGVIHKKGDMFFDTKNEIDILLTRDLVPVFISCKNGETPKEALYELETVADRFGGRYARKFMVATYISSNESKRKYFLQRAEDMHINVLSDVHSLTRQELKALLKKKIK